MKKLRFVLEAHNGAPEIPRVKLKTGSKRHRNTTTARTGTPPDSHTNTSGPTRTIGAKPEWCAWPFPMAITDAIADLPELE